MFAVTSAPARGWLRAFAPWVAGAVVLVVMLASTHYESRADAAKAAPGAFSAKAYAAKAFPTLSEKITSDAVEVSTLAPALDGGVAKAGDRYGHSLGAGGFAFPVTATGTVRSVDANFAELDVRGLPEGWVVRIPLGLAVNGAAIRDATGTVKYGDFPDQTAYQEVATELEKIERAKVLEPADLKGAKGKRVVVAGGFVTGGPAKAFLVQPVSIRVAS